MKPLRILPVSEEDEQPREGNPHTSTGRVRQKRKDRQKTEDGRMAGERGRTLGESGIPETKEAFHGEGRSPCLEWAK